ncbi:stage II sporulation protein M [Paenibacillus hodogayensis]|uniref:Stage II sporulation protein M n=1 Tax=Paenibacillus hodogayensis TaxID=279208 RepID=A0ABV5W8I1_9BACL
MIKAWGTLFVHLKGMQKYMIAATLVFIAGVVLGYADSGQFEAILQGQLEGLQKLARDIAEKEHSMIWLFGYILLNNTIKSVLIVFAGVFFGVLPLFFLLINGMVIGYLAQLQAEAGHLGLFLKGIIPHGILEIPAVILACAYGIKLGAIMGKGLLGAGSGRGRAAFVAELQHFMRVALPLIALLVVSLLVAAIIESFITPLIMKL